MKKTDLAYFAGILDGEGCIYIEPVNDPRRKAHPHWHKSYRLMVSVVNTDEWLLKQLQFSFEGQVYLRNRETSKTRNTWVWLISARKAKEFLKAIIPYLHLKRPQAKLAIQFQEHRKKQGQRMTDEHSALEQAQKILMSKLNKSRL